MDAGARDQLRQTLAGAFGAATDVTPAEGQATHILLPALELPEPWSPTPTRALTVWQDWPSVRPQFVVDLNVVGENGEPPRSNSTTYLLGEAWRQFSFAFAWQGDDPVHAVQLWLTRFSAERT